MNNRTIYITAQDMEQLKKLLGEEKNRHGYGNGRGEHLKGLETELNRSIQVAADKVPPDIITMHSKACLIDLESGEELVYTLVFPNEADVRQDKISVLAPIGTAMLGYQVSDGFEWPVPDGVRHLQVVSVLYQPEAAGTHAEVSASA